VALGVGLAIVVALGLGAMAGTTAGEAQDAGATELVLVGEAFPVMLGRGDDSVVLSPQSRFALLLTPCYTLHRSLRGVPPNHRQGDSSR
jgi:hypothetical protein